MNTKKLYVLVTALAAVGMAGEPQQAPKDLVVLAKALTVPLKIARGEMPAFTITVDGQMPLGAGPEVTWQVAFVRADAERFSLSFRTMGQPMIDLVRDTGETRLVVHVRKVAFVGKGPLAAALPLRLDALIGAIPEIEPKAPMYLAMAKAGQPQSMAFLIQQFAQLQRVPDKAPATFVADRGEDKGQVTVTTTADGTSIERIAWQDGEETNAVTIRITEATTLPQAVSDGLGVVPVPRAELEHTLARAAVRALDALRYSRRGDRPDDETRQSGAGSLTVDGGRRVVRLKGSAREIGRQHGALLPAETKRVCETIVHLAGLRLSLLQRRWIPDTLRLHMKQTLPRIPADFREEMEGLAEGAGLPLELVQMANDFPGLFRGAGFIVLPEAAETKKLYHGHTLDGGRGLGIQRDTALFVVQKGGAQPFMHLGFAGLVGVAAGMNRAKVVASLATEQSGSWDSMPRTFLVRAALEQASTFEQAVDVLRTGRAGGCLVSDGAKNRAAQLFCGKDGIAQVHLSDAPQRARHYLVDVPGQGSQSVAASLKKDLGKMTSYKSRKLLRPPLSDGDSVYSVLFMPQGHDVDIAIARGSSPAYKERYKRYDLKDFLPKPEKKPAPPKP